MLSAAERASDRKSALARVRSLSRGARPSRARLEAARAELHCSARILDRVAIRWRTAAAAAARERNSCEGAQCKAQSVWLTQRHRP